MFSKIQMCLSSIIAAKEGKQGQFLSKQGDRCLYDYECVTVENVLENGLFMCSFACIKPLSIQQVITNHTVLCK